MKQPDTTEKTRRPLSNGYKNDDSYFYPASVHRLPSPVNSRGIQWGGAPLGRRGRDSQGDRPCKGPLERFLSPISLPFKEMGPPEAMGRRNEKQMQAANPQKRKRLPAAAETASEQTALAPFPRFPKAPRKLRTASLLLLLKPKRPLRFEEDVSPESTSGERTASRDAFRRIRTMDGGVSPAGDPLSQRGERGERRAGGPFHKGPPDPSSRPRGSAPLDPRRGVYGGRGTWDEGRRTRDEGRESSGTVLTDFLPTFPKKNGVVQNRPH